MDNVHLFLKETPVSEVLKSRQISLAALNITQTL